MGLFSGKKADSPNYQALAEQDYQKNLDVQRNDTWANRANQYGPEGSLEWTARETIDPSTGKAVTQWDQNVELSPELQRLYDSDLTGRQNKSDVAKIATGRLKNDYRDPMDWSGLQDWGAVGDSRYLETQSNGRVDPRYTQAIGDQVGDPNQFRQRGEDASYESQMRRITPEYERSKAALEVKLRNQGLNPDDRAYQNQMLSLDNNYNDARQSARLTASGEGRQESSLNFGQQMDRNQNIYNQNLTANAQNYGMDAGSDARYFDERLQASAQNNDQFNDQFDRQNSLRQQQLAEALTKRGFGLNEANAMMSGQQVAMPSFGGYNTQSNGPQSNMMEAGVNQSNFDQANSQSFWSSLGSLANTGVKAYGVGK
jgi:hypothetical protein